MYFGILIFIDWKKYMYTFMNTVFLYINLSIGDTNYYTNFNTYVIKHNIKYLELIIKSCTHFLFWFKTIIKISHVILILLQNVSIKYKALYTIFTLFIKFRLILTIIVTLLYQIYYKWKYNEIIYIYKLWIQSFLYFE